MVAKSTACYNRAHLHSRSNKLNCEISLFRIVDEKIKFVLNKIRSILVVVSAVKQVQATGPIIQEYQILPGISTDFPQNQ